MTAPVLRVGLTLRGPRGGLREVVEFWWGREQEAREQANEREAAADGAEPIAYDGFWRRVSWRSTPRSKPRVAILSDWLGWSTRATVVAEGTGEVAPWV